MDEMGNLIQQLIELVKQTAPELWRIALLQVGANRIQTIAWAAFCLVAGIVLPIIGSRNVKSVDEDEQAVGGFTVVAGIILLIVFFGLSVFIAKTFINPEFYAIKVLLGLGQPQ